LVVRPKKFQRNCMVSSQNTSGANEDEANACLVYGTAQGRRA